MVPTKASNATAGVSTQQFEPLSDMAKAVYSGRVKRVLKGLAQGNDAAEFCEPVKCNLISLAFMGYLGSIDTGKDQERTVLTFGVIILVLLAHGAGGLDNYYAESERTASLRAWLKQAARAAADLVSTGQKFSGREFLTT